jgi:PEGA domain
MSDTVVKRILIIMGVIFGVSLSVSIFTNRDSSVPLTTPSANTPPPVEKVQFSIQSDPPGAAVTMGEKAMGTTPLTLDVVKNETITYVVKMPDNILEYDLYKPFTGVYQATKDDAVSVWIDRTSAGEKEQQKTAYAAKQEALEQQRKQQQISANNTQLEDAKFTICVI